MVEGRVARVIARLEGICFSTVPTYGDVMTVEEFQECVSTGTFIDSDGEGRWALADAGSWPRIQMSAVYVRPSTAKERPAWATHVVWFNK